MIICSVSKRMENCSGEGVLSKWKLRASGKGDSSSHRGVVLSVLKGVAGGIERFKGVRGGGEGEERKVVGVKFVGEGDWVDGVGDAGSWFSCARERCLGTG